MIKIYKDYYLKDGVILYKENLNEKKHLMWKHGGVPCIDAELWDGYKEQVQDIVFKTKTRTFKSSKDNFEKNKGEFSGVFGRQYYIPYKNWEIKLNI